jgi:flagellin-like hook-associated protein FlgL
MTTPGSPPEQGLPSGAQEPSPDELRAKVSALADQVRALANGRHQALRDAPAAAAAAPGTAARPQAAEDVASADRPSRPAAEPPARVEREGVESAPVDEAETLAPPEPAPQQAAADATAAVVEEFAELSGRLLEAVIDTAELAAAEIRAGAEREAADIRERADAAIGEADAALARYREALAALAVETERIEHSITALREQAEALEVERARVDAAIDVLRRRPAR